MIRANRSEHKIYIYNFSDLKLIDHIETISNIRGLCASSYHPSNNVFVCPGLQRGHVRVELYDQKKTTLIEAHESSLACIACTFDGTRVATASDTGTLIRIFDTSTGVPLQELRRGADRAEIYSIAFNPTLEWLATSSDKGTIHIFALDTKVSGKANKVIAASQPQTPSSADGDKQSQSSSSTSTSSLSSKVSNTNPTSSLSFMKSLLPKYFSSEWSFAQYRVPDVHTIVTFSPVDPHSVIILSAEGTYYKAKFDPTKQQDCVSEHVALFLHDSQNK